MKSNQAFISVMAVVALISFNACSGDNSDGFEIFEGDISRYTPPCDWKPLLTDKVYILNSEEQLDECTECDMSGGSCDVDFSNNTILLVSGCIHCQVSETEWTLIKRADNEYTLRLEMKLKYTPYPETWCIALNSPKIPSGSDVELEVSYDY